jgi:release factor glutamine methyltransferase
MQIYEPAEDSLLLAQCIKKISSRIIKRNPNSVALDMGSGSGIQAETLVKSGFIKKNILASDISKEAVYKLRKKGFKSVNSDLFAKIKGKFDIILFNPPYLPYNKYDNNNDTCGGKKGYETALKFLRHLKSHLNKKGIALLLISSLTNPDVIRKEIRKQNLKFRQIASQNLFFEKILVLEIKKILKDF